MSIYGCKHEAWIGSDPDGEPAVCLRNTHDGEYVQYFTEQSELLDFIRELVKLNNEFASNPCVNLLIRQIDLDKLWSECNEDL